MCLVFTAFALVNARTLVEDLGPGGIRLRAVFAGVFMVFLAWGVWMMLRYQRRIVSEFIYDGVTFEFRTIGRRATQIKQVEQIKSVRDWRGRGGVLGARIDFEKGGKVYLGYFVRNGGVAGERMRLDIARRR